VGCWFHHTQASDITVQNHDPALKKVSITIVSGNANGILIPPQVVRYFDPKSCYHIGNLSNYNAIFSRRPFSDAALGLPSHPGLNITS
jgi:hypothetical protein